LLRHFGSVASIEQATLAELQETSGVGPELAATIRTYFESQKK
jgi:ERCC4-type nuclease